MILGFLIVGLLMGRVPVAVVVVLAVVEVLGVGAGEEGRELAGVVGVDSMSPPSPSLSIAESSIRRFLLRGCS